MKSTAIDSGVLGGQGGIGSKIHTVPNPAPSQGPMAGVDASSPLAISGATDGALSTTDHHTMPSGPHMPSSQYSTQGPIPKG
jgi:hypothetical protein